MQFTIGTVLNDQSLSVLEVAPAIEERGFYGMSCGEHTHMPVDTRHQYASSDELPDIYKRFPDPWTTLAMAAAVTERLRVQTSIALLAEHNVLALAKTIATLDYWSGGRVVIGAGYGWNAPEMRNNGVDPKRNKDVFREKVRAMKELWTQETASFDGEFVRFSESWAWPKPVQKPHPPILIGAAPRKYTYRDVAELGQGWMPDATWLGERLACERLPERLEQLRARVAEAGRDPSDLTIQLSGVTGFRKNTVEEIQARCPTPKQVEAWRELGVTALVLGAPLKDRDLFLRSLDIFRELQTAVNGE